MSLGTFTQTPLETKRYTVDYAEWLDDGETVSAVTFSILDPRSDEVIVGELEVVSHSINEDGNLLAFFISGGTENSKYDLRILATTSGGQEKEDSLIFSIRDL